MSAKFVDYHSAKAGSALDMAPDVSKIALPSGAVLLEALMVGFIGEEQRARAWVIDDGLLKEAAIVG
jgi:hypothetical protein